MTGSHEVRGSIPLGSTIAFSTFILALGHFTAFHGSWVRPHDFLLALNLNVWTPELRDGRKRTVMFYIHGGAYSNGSGSSALYDGVRLCRRGDVVVVTVNHRLNAFGYLYLARFGGPEFADSGNTGQLDLVLALRWVKENIADGSALERYL